MEDKRRMEQKMIDEREKKRREEEEKRKKEEEQRKREQEKDRQREKKLGEMVPANRYARKWDDDDLGRVINVFLHFYINLVLPLQFFIKNLLISCIQPTTLLIILTVVDQFIWIKIDFNFQMKNFIFNNDEKIIWQWCSLITVLKNDHQFLSNYFINRQLEKVGWPVAQEFYN